MNYADLNVIEALPDYFHGPLGGEDAFRRLAGARIVKIGASSDRKIEGGGLILDYELNAQKHRLVLAFTELGMWIEYDSFKAIPDESRQ